MRLLITGAAGFIGFHLALARLRQGDRVVGVDNLNDYYDPRLKQARLALLQAHDNFIFHQADIADNTRLDAIFEQHHPQQVVNLAAQAGVRYSMTNPQPYIQSNLLGFNNILEACRHYQVEHLVYASTSSVYGANTTLPYQEEQNVDHPLSLYAATKKANELMAHSYSHLYQLPTTALRFFTVYGPWGRPDMAFFSFTRDILAGKPIEIFNHGLMTRDFTYIDDIVAGISLVLGQVAAIDSDWCSENPNPSSSNAPYKIYNMGSGMSVNLLDYIEALEQALGKKAIKIFLPMQNCDVTATHADVSHLNKATGYQPKVGYQEGLSRFVAWYKDYFQENAVV